MLEMLEMKSSKPETSTLLLTGDDSEIYIDSNLVTKMKDGDCHGHSIYQFVSRYSDCCHGGLLLLQFLCKLFPYLWYNQGAVMADVFLSNDHIKQGLRRKDCRKETDE
jgi:hypothetical protein